MSTTVEVPNTYSGPLDLLLYLIRRDEIDIHDIPISHLTREYLAVLKQADFISVDEGGEFIAMATMLLEIKSRYLAPLPVTETDADEAELFDPRRELVTALLEYKYFKQVAGELAKLSQQQSHRFPRQLPPAALPASAPTAPGSGDPLALFAAFQKIVQKILLAQRRREIVNTEVPTDTRIAQIVTALTAHAFITFSALLSAAPSRDELVGFFIAMLELVRQKKIFARQSDDYGEIYLTPRAEEKVRGAGNVAAFEWRGKFAPQFLSHSGAAKTTGAAKITAPQTSPKLATIFPAFSGAAAKTGGAKISGAAKFAAPSRAAPLTLFPAPRR
jgi:segregation and condensation protein A